MYGFGEIAERLRRSTVQVFDGEPARGRKARGGGSGVIWRADGAVLTNAHVARSDAPEVELWDGRRFAARVVSRDGRRDLALLRIDGAGFEPAPPGNSSAVRAGEFVLAIGSPLGFAGAISRGVVHSTGPSRHGEVRLDPRRRTACARQLGRAAGQCARRSDRHQYGDLQRAGSRDSVECCGRIRGAGAAAGAGSDAAP